MAAAWAIAFLAAAGVSLVGTPLLRRLALAVGFLDQPAHRKSHHVPVPYMGGVAIGIGALVGMVAGTGVVPKIAVVTLAALVLGLTGLLDDKRTLSPKLRLATQVLAGVAALAVGVRIHATDVAAFDLALTLLWIVGITNAFNLLDNMDGLAGGIATMASAAVFALAALGGQVVVGGLAAALVGACIGFLAYNVRPAAIYMGDAGSLFLGYLLAIATLELDPALRPPASFLVPIILLGLAILDTSTVTFARLRRGRAVSEGGRDHLSHRLVARGYTPGYAVAVLVSAQAALGMIAVAAGRDIVSLPIACASAFAVVAFVAALTARAKVYDQPVVGLPKKLFVAAGGAVLLAVLVALPAGLALLGARADLADAATAAERGLSAARRGERDTAERELTQAAAAFDEAHDRMTTPLTDVGLVVPVLSSNLRAARTLAGSGADLARTGAEAARSVDPERLRVRNGRVPIDEIAKAEPVLRKTADELAVAARDVSRIRRPFLLPPVRSAVGRVEGRLLPAAREAERAAEAAAMVPRLLGADGPRRYFLAVQNNAELRATGGFVGNYGEIVADDGTLKFATFGRINDLNAKVTGDEQLNVDEDFRRLYGGFQIAQTWQNINLSPDLPTVAKVVAELYPQSGGNAIDGIIAVDPFGLRALLQLTGPIKVAGWDEPLSARNVVDVTLRDAYDRYEQDQRVDFLGQVANQVWATFLTSDLPAPARLTSVLSKAAREKHLMVHSLREDEADFLAGLRLNGALDEPVSDSLAILNQNAAGNKTDYYLHRRFDIDVELAPIGYPIGDELNVRSPKGVGVSTSLTVAMRNEAPTSGHARFAIGPYSADYQAGENRTFFALYTPHDFNGATVDGKNIGLDSDEERGHRVFSTFISIPSKQERTLATSLNGVVPLDDGWYELVLPRQATVHPDELDLTVRVPDGWEITGTRGLDRPATPTQTITLRRSMTEDVRIAVRIESSDRDVR